MAKTLKKRRAPKAVSKNLIDRPLTRRQELFVKELVSRDGQITLREAAINAGYPAGSAHSRAYEMTNPHMCPHVCRAIREYREELDAKYGVNYQRHLKDLQTIRDAALSNGAYSAAVQAEYRRGQAQGDIYVSKSEVRHGTIDSMSKDEVMKALEDIKSSYAPITIQASEESKPNASNRDKARIRLLPPSEGGDEEVLEEVDPDED